MQTGGILLAVAVLLFGVPIAIASLECCRAPSGNTTWSTALAQEGTPRADRIFPICARLKNGTGLTHELYCFEFSGDLASALEIVDATPEWKTRSVEPDGSVRAWFDAPIEDGESLEIAFHVRAKHAGQFKGAIRPMLDDLTHSAPIPYSLDVDP